MKVLLPRIFTKKDKGFYGFLRSKKNYNNNDKVVFQHKYSFEDNIKF
jgi:hypothetical protein